MQTILNAVIRSVTYLRAGDSGNATSCAKRRDIRSKRWRATFNGKQCRTLLEAASVPADGYRVGYGGTSYEVIRLRIVPRPKIPDPCASTIRQASYKITDPDFHAWFVGVVATPPFSASSISISPIHEQMEKSKSPPGRGFHARSTCVAARPASVRGQQGGNRGSEQAVIGSTLHGSMAAALHQHGLARVAGLF